MIKLHRAASKALLTPERWLSRDEILARPCPVPSERGLYAWYFQEVPSGVPIEGCVRWRDHFLLYVGISPSRPTSKQNLAKRLRYHMRGNAKGSTLRLTLGCLLASDLGLTLQRAPGRDSLTFGSGEGRLSAWLAAHARVAWVIHPDRRRHHPEAVAAPQPRAQ